MFHNLELHSNRHYTPLNGVHVIFDTLQPMSTAVRGHSWYEQPTSLTSRMTLQRPKAILTGFSSTMVGSFFKIVWVKFKATPKVSLAFEGVPLFVLAVQLDGLWKCAI